MRKIDNRNDSIFKKKGVLILPVLLVMPFFVVHVGNENGLLKLLTIPSYYSDLLLGLVCSLGLGAYLIRLMAWLDNRFPRLENLGKRILVQIVWGILLPSAVLLFVEMAYLSFLGIGIAESSIFYLELPLIVLLTSVVNLILVVLEHISVIQSAKLSENQREAVDYTKKCFVVQFGKRFLNVPNRDIAYFRVQNKMLFLVTKEGKSYLYNGNLAEISRQLDTSEYFQLNRQVIAKRTSILETNPTHTRRLEIRLRPPLGEKTFVSKSRSSHYLDWLQKG